jgi:hypothetical protein
VDISLALDLSSDMCEIIPFVGLKVNNENLKVINV